MILLGLKTMHAAPVFSVSKTSCKPNAINTRTMNRPKPQTSIESSSSFVRPNEPQPQVEDENERESGSSTAATVVLDCDSEVATESTDQKEKRSCFYQPN